MTPIDRSQSRAAAPWGLFLAFVLVSCSTSAPTAAPALEGGGDEWALARAASDAGRWEEAAGRWNELFVRHGDDWEIACAETARALCHLRDHASAQGVLALGLRLDPDHPQLLEANGQILAERGFRRAAERCYLDALQVEPERASALLALGRLRLELGLEESARDPLNQRISLGYADAETCWLLAEATRRSGDPVAALGAYQRAFEFGEQPPNVLVSASTLYFDDRVRGHCPEARQLVRRWLRDATARDPQNTEAHYYLGLVLIDCDREDEALRRLRRAVETDPTHVPSLTQLARLHARRGELDGARQMAERALDLVDSESERRQLEELLATASGDTAEPLR